MNTSKKYTLRRHFRRQKYPLTRAILAVLFGTTVAPFSWAATIQGTTFQDLNSDGTRQSCEPIQTKTTVFLRDNAKADAWVGGFFSALSDANGRYTSTGHSANGISNWGSFTLWAQIPDGQVQTAPAKGEGMATYDFKLASATDTVTIDIGFGAKTPPANKAPTVKVANAKVTIKEGGTVNFAATFTDPDNDAMCGVKWDFGDGSTADTLNASHIYAKYGTYTATVTVTDVRGGTATAKVTVTVQSPPIVNAGTDTASEVGQVVNFTGSFTDPDGTAAYKYIWKFGDGNTKSGTVRKIGNIPAAYAYTSDGVFTATLEVTDRQGNTGSQTMVVNVRGINTDPCATGVPTVKSNLNFGVWNSPGTWSTGKVPGDNDWVLIQGGHTVLLPNTVSSDNASRVQVKGICIAPSGILQSAFNSLTAATTWINVYAATIRNQGSIQSSPGVNGSPLGNTYKNATAASHVKFFAYKFVNDPTGLIVANGRGGDDFPYLYFANQTGINGQGGNGAQIEIYPSIMLNQGKIQGGRGGDAKGFRDGSLFMVGNMIGGRGGSVRVFVMDQAKSSTTGTIAAGCGGNAEGINQNTVAPGNGGEVSINVGTVAGKVAVCPGQRRVHSPIYQPWYAPYFYQECHRRWFHKHCETRVAWYLAGYNFVGWDPEHLKATSAASFENLDEIVINVGNDGTIDLSELKEGAISAYEHILIAAGKGGVVDLSKINSKVFLTKNLEVAADKVILPGGKILTPADSDVSVLKSIAQAPEPQNGEEKNELTVSVTPAKIIYNAAFSNPDRVIGEPNTTIPIDLTLLNTGPEVDTYTLTVTNDKGWSMDIPPETVTINSQRRSDLTFNVTLPATRGEENVITVTATSQSDLNVQAVAEIRVGVKELELVTPRDGTKADLTIVLDNTESMSEQILAVSNALETFLVNNVHNHTPPIVELITFKDADEIVSRITTQEVGEVIGRIRDIQPAGGGTCPNASVGALEYALTNLNSNGQIMLVTAASGEKEASAVVANLQAQGIKTHVLLAGSCGDEAGDRAFYEQIATRTGGTFSFMPRGNPNSAEAFKQVTTEVVTNAVEDLCAQQPEKCPALPPVDNGDTGGTGENGDTDTGDTGDNGNTGDLPPLSASGKVVDNAGTPVANVTVRVGLQTAITDAKGEWQLANVSAGFYMVTANQESYTFPIVNCDLGDDKPCQANFQALPQTGAKASGTVRDKSQQPLAGVQVQIDNKTTLTNAEGKWSLTSLTEGKQYEATFSKSGYRFANQPVQCQQNQPQRYGCYVGAPSSELQLTVGASPSPFVRPAGKVTYNLTVTNKGQDLATGIVLTEALSKDAKVISMQPAEGGNCDTNTLRCTLPDLAAGASTKVKLIVTAADQPTTLENTAKVSSATYPDDLVKTTTTVKPYLSVSVKDEADPVKMLDKLHYTYTVELDPVATEAATGVTLVSQLPSGVELQTAKTTLGDCDSSQFPTVTCPLPDLSGGGKATVEMTVNLTDAGLLVLTNEAKVMAANYPEYSERERTNILIPDNIKLDMMFVVDTTNSMQEEITGVTSALQKFIATVDSSQTPSAALITFKDDVKIEAFTQDMKVLQGAMTKLKAYGGGTCPEASAEALALAVQYVKEGGTIFFSTDASPYEDTSLEDVTRQIDEQGVKFHAIVSGDCATEGSGNEVK